MEIIVGKEIENVCPNFVGACVEAKVKNSNFSQELWKDIDTLGEEFRNKLTVDTLKEISGIAATRHIYRICGKDPSRYRPASEALIRRILQGKALYQINTLVDLINLASMKYGYSIGGFDADKIIGRGTINIQGLPVYRDDFGGVGTPTSDNERTKITINTTHLLVLINGYDGNEELVKQNAEYIQQLLKRFCESNGGSFFIYK